MTISQMSHCILPDEFVMAFEPTPPWRIHPAQNVVCLKIFGLILIEILMRYILQLFGRVGREGTVLPRFLFIELVDEGFKKLKEYLANKMPVYMKYATSVKKVIYRDYDMNEAYDRYVNSRTRILVKPPFDIVIPKKKLVKPPFSIRGYEK